METGHGPVTELAAQAILRPLGIPFPHHVLAVSSGEAGAAAKALGENVVLKIVSPDIVHKAAVGGVRTQVTSESAPQRYEEMINDVRRSVPDARIDGVLVQQEAAGVPVLVGTKLDPRFGPVVVVGTGGVDAEVIGDRALSLAPVDLTGAEELLGRTRVGALLHARYPGQRQTKERLCALIVTVSTLAYEIDHLMTIELNPVLVSEKQVVAVDVLVEWGTEGLSR